jgi:predicted nucleotidyltransferase
MFEDITLIDLRIIGLYTPDYAAGYSIRQMTQLLDINYSHAFKRIKRLVKNSVLSQIKEGQANRISLNLKNIESIQLVSFVEEQESKRLKNSTLRLLAKEAALIDPLSCVGVFGSRVSGRDVKESDWDVFVITQSPKRTEMEKILAKFPYDESLQLQVFSVEEFRQSLLSPAETVVRHIVRNKLIIYNPHPFYNIIMEWEKTRYAPSQTDQRTVRKTVKSKGQTHKKRRARADTHKMGKSSQ